MYSYLKSNFKISHRLYLGFSSLIFLLAAVVAGTLWEVTEIKQDTSAILDVQTPTTQAIEEIAYEINTSIAA